MSGGRKGREKEAEKGRREKEEKRGGMTWGRGRGRIREEIMSKGVKMQRKVEKEVERCSVTMTSPVCCSLSTKLSVSASGPATRRRNNGCSPSASLHT